MRLGSVLFTIILFSSSSWARQGETPPTLALGLDVSAIQGLELEGVDADAELAKVALTKPGRPLQIGVTRKVSIDAFADGDVQAVADGILWRQRVSIPGATEMSLGFSRFALPEGAKVWIIGSDPLLPDYYQGPFTHEDPVTNGAFWTPVVPGDEMHIEILVPDSNFDAVSVEVGTVVGGFVDAFGLRGGPGLEPKGIQSCNIDIACSEADAFRDEQRAVIRYSHVIGGGSFLCTGTLLMDVPRSFRPYMLSAAHCDVRDAASLVAFFNYESPSCGQLGGGSLNQSISGATKRVEADQNISDSALFELSSAPPASFNVYYAGWDRSGTIPAGDTVGIHHPGGNEKMIAVNTDRLRTGPSCIGGGASSDNTHWFMNWERGTTQQGSSGSGLFDTSGRVIGLLSGGSASCSNPRGDDCYGAFAVAWTGRPNNQNLQPFLDPNNTGATTVDGSNPGGSGGGGGGGAGDDVIAAACATSVVPIPDNSAQGATASVNFDARGTINAVAVQVDARHTFIGDLTVSLTQVSTGRTVRLLNRPGGGNCSGDNIVEARFADVGTASGDASCTSNTPALTGTLRPTEPLSAFSGTQVAGEWRLTVTDSAAQDTGTLDNFCFVATGTPETGGGGGGGGGGSGTSGSGPNRRVDVFLPVDTAQACPGFYIGEVAALGSEGRWNMEILLTAGQRLLQGGLNLGGGFEGANRPGFAAFNIANAANEPQRVAVNLGLTKPDSMNVQFDIVRRDVDPAQVVVSGVTNGGVAEYVLNPGFYVVQVFGVSGTIVPAQFSLALETSFVNRPGGAFQGGVNLGGFMSNAGTGTPGGFGALCISEAQNVSFETSAAADGVGNLRIRVLDAQRNVVIETD
ncbi:MAG: proprotein convertase P-domain-containing protein [Pseudomonadota bacterium]